MKSLAICALLGEVSAVKIPVTIDVPENMLQQFQANPIEYLRPHQSFIGSSLLDFPSFNIEFPKFEQNPEMKQMQSEMDKKMAEAWGNE